MGPNSDDWLSSQERWVPRCGDTWHPSGDQADSLYIREGERRIRGIRYRMAAWLLAASDRGGPAMGHWGQAVLVAPQLPPVRSSTSLLASLPAVVSSLLSSLPLGYLFLPPCSLSLKNLWAQRKNNFFLAKVVSALIFLSVSLTTLHW